MSNRNKDNKNLTPLGNIGPAKQKNVIQVNLQDCDSVKCSGCQGTEFTTTFTIKKISPLISRTGKQELIAIESYVCSACGESTGIIKK